MASSLCFQMQLVPLQHGVAAAGAAAADVAPRHARVRDHGVRGRAAGDEVLFLRRRGGRRWFVPGGGSGQPGGVRGVYHCEDGRAGRPRGGGGGHPSSRIRVVRAVNDNDWLMFFCED